MFQIDKSSNRISALEKMTFSELKFKEREHLQEWLANTPESLGEDFLIIQKEFDGFDETRERLDLLALDKDGNLVIIENKLDDSGRDVVWQAIKYASYSSNLNKNQVIEIYQQYLRKIGSDDDAEESLTNFLCVEDLDEIILNKGNGQRVIFVAANFRKEVTSTALWLLSHGINVQCFKVTPYEFNDEYLLDVKQIIPVPEVKDLMIGMSEKEAEEKGVEAKQKKVNSIRLKFWEQLLRYLRESSCNIYDNISPSHDHWSNAGSGVGGAPYALIFGKKLIRIELTLNNASQKINKMMFDELYKSKSEIEEAFGKELTWERLDNKKSSRVKFEEAIDGYNEENWPYINNWMFENLQKIEVAIKSPLVAASTLVRSSSLSK
ncbi:DUF4268 domain-containing protein [Marinifilum sp. JC120]|nr:DUF4268 domain-containing protein [Marinifilum sp. JC120]